LACEITLAGAVLAWQSPIAYVEPSNCAVDTNLA
jgi:hypothetical protein